MGKISRKLNFPRVPNRLRNRWLVSFYGSFYGNFRGFCKKFKENCCLISHWGFYHPGTCLRIPMFPHPSPLCPLSHTYTNGLTAKWPCPVLGDFGVSTSPSSSYSNCTLSSQQDPYNLSTLPFSTFSSRSQSNFLKTSKFSFMKIMLLFLIYFGFWHWCRYYIQGHRT